VTLCPAILSLHHHLGLIATVLIVRSYVLGVAHCRVCRRKDGRRRGGPIFTFTCFKISIGVFIVFVLIFLILRRGSPSGSDHPHAGSGSHRSYMLLGLLWAVSYEIVIISVHPRPGLQHRWRNVARATASALPYFSVTTLPPHPPHPPDPHPPATLDSGISCP